uniref:BTB domain-containing protein n=1 Tax=Oryza punctata TaxID=4537 RepID=A0A0E0LU03_ORYPU
MAAPSPSSGDRAPIRETASTQRLTIAPYSSYSDLSSGKPVTSGLFSLGGHRWDILFFPGGYYRDSPYAAIFLRLVSNLHDEQVRLLVDFTLVDRRGGMTGGGEDDGSYTRCGYHVFGPGLSGVGRCCFGFPEFILQHDLAASGVLLSGDRLVVECAVRLAVDADELLRRGPRPLDDELRRGLRRMLEDGTGADVTFVVRGERFRAHRCVLAARSPVLLAELYGPAARAMGGTRRRDADADEATTTITIEDMEPEAFAAMLRFAYDDTLPELPGNNNRDAAGVHMAQHLLAAADVYGMDALSQACQNRLAGCVTLATAADTYALADKLGLRLLKAAVVRDVAAASTSARGIEAVKKSEGFRRLAAADAATADEMVRKVVAASARVKRAEVSTNHQN